MSDHKLYIQLLTGISRLPLCIVGFTWYIQNNDNISPHMLVAMNLWSIFYICLTIDQTLPIRARPVTHNGLRWIFPLVLDGLSSINRLTFTSWGWFILFTNNFQKGFASFIDLAVEKNKRLIDLSKKSGYTRVFSTDYGSNVITRNNFCLRRHHIKKSYSMGHFEKIIENSIFLY